MMLSFDDYKQLTEQSPILIWRAALNKECDYFNDRWLKYTGRTMEQEVGNGWAEGVHPDDFDRCVEIYTKNFDQKQIFEMEYRLKRHDGEYRWILDRGVPRYSDNQFVGFIGSCIDVHESVIARKKAELEAKEKETKIEKLVELLPICSICKNIKDDAGYWQKVEMYIQSIVSETNFTHSMCPVCIKKYFEKKGG